MGECPTCRDGLLDGNPFSTTSKNMSPLTGCIIMSKSTSDDTVDTTTVLAKVTCDITSMEKPKRSIDSIVNDCTRGIVSDDKRAKLNP